MINRFQLGDTVCGEVVQNFKINPTGIVTKGMVITINSAFNGTIRIKDEKSAFRFIWKDEKAKHCRMLLIEKTIQK